MKTLANPCSRAGSLAVLPLLGAQLQGWEPGLDAAMALGVVQAAVALRRDRTPDAMTAQVRLVYLVLLIVGSVPPARFVHLLLFAASFAHAAFGLCVLGRLVALMPWNRRDPMDAGLRACTGEGR